MNRTLAVATLAAATVASWAAWLSWQTGYVTDERTGSVSGPYSWWQVAGCVVTLAVVAAVAGRFLSPLIVVPVMAQAVTVPWAVAASTSDESGLWLVGAMLVLAGTAAGTALVAGTSRLLSRRIAAH